MHVGNIGGVTLATADPSKEQVRQTEQRTTRPRVRCSAYRRVPERPVWCHPVRELNRTYFARTDLSAASR